MKNVAAVGVFWGAHAEREPGFIAAGLNEVFGWWRAGKLRPRVARTFRLDEAAQGMAALLTRGFAGKIVITP